MTLFPQFVLNQFELFFAQKLQYFLIFPADNLILQLEMGKSVKTWKVFAE